MTRRFVGCCLFACFFLGSSTGPAALQNSAAQTPLEAAREESPEEQRERQIHERFVELLKRSPRFGTALDRVYGYHVERGTLDTFVEELQEGANQNDSDGTEWMLLGLFEYQRGNDGQAVKAFGKAEQLREEDPLASYYLGRAYLLLGDDQKAAEAYERALARKPTRIDLMEIFQGLGRIYQRAQDKTKAAEVWDRLETLFPDDTQVLEEIAYITAEEGDYEHALKRYQKLAADATEPYRRVQYDMQAGKMLIRLNKSDDAIELFEGTLKRLKPESWLFRDVRRQIEEVYLSTDDFNGLTKYYEKWLEQHDDDVEAMGRLAHILAMQGRLPEAQQWYARAIKLSPSNTDLRESLIARLIDAARYEQAIEQYAQLDKIDPGNPDYIEKWGQLVFENPDGNRQTQTEEAKRIWNKMLEGHEDDPVIVTRVADLLRYAKLTEDAIELYKKAIALAPNNSQYREYLGEYYHILKRTADAKETWQQIAAGPRHSRETLVRLAEVYAGFGFDEDALKTMKEACDLDPEFSDRLQYAVMLTDAGEFDEAHQQLDLALELAENDEELDNVLRQRIDAFLAANQLQSEIDKLQARLEGPAADSAKGWLRLAVYLQAISRTDQAVDAIERALALDEKSIRTLSLAAGLYESVGRLDISVDTYRRLSNIDRQFRSEYLQKIASLEMRLGRTDDAIAAAEALIAAAPGNPENYSFYADLCFRLGKTDEGLDSLRRAVRANPGDPAALLTLAQALANQFRTADAIELYWQAFEKSEVLDDKLHVISAITELYLRTSHFDRLIEKLEIKQRLGSQNRDITLCIAAAYKNLGDFVKSREILEQLLTEENRDVVLLQELVRLANSASEYDEAARYQRRILELSPTPENELQLAQILLQSGEVEEAEALWIKLVAAEQDEHRVFKSLDQMILLGKHETALAILEKLLRENPDNWEALYRKGIALWKLGKKAESLAAFDALDALKLDDEELSSEAKHQEEQFKLRHASSSFSATRSTPYPPVIMRVRAYSYAQQLLSNSNSARQTRWSPEDYGQARVAGIAVRVLNAQSEGEVDDYLANLKQDIETQAKTNPQKLWDLFYLQYANQQPDTRYRDQYEIGKRLSQALADDAAKFAYVSSLRLRNYRSGVNSTTAQETATPLADDEITHMLNCFEQIYSSHPEWLIYGGIVHSVSTELRIAGKEERANELYQQLVQEAQDEQSLGTAMQIAATAGSLEDVIELARKGEEQFSSSGNKGQYETYRQQAFLTLLQKLIEDERFDDVQRLLFAQFEHQKRRYLSMPVYRRSSVSQTNAPLRVQVRSGTARRTQAITYPTPNPFFNSADIIFAFSAFEGFLQHKKSNDLIDALAARADADQDLDEVVSRLALSYVEWWSGNQTTSMLEITAVAELHPNEPFLQLQLIDAYYRSKRFKEALKIVNQIQAPDRKLLEQREIIALKLAVQVGDLDRAREAAKRLFGMQLKTDLQIQLAAQMNQLGMHELADAVLARTRRKAGNQSATLVQLMQQYASKGNNEIANQIAMQIIRRTSPATARTTSSSRQRTELSYRKAAIVQLNKTGELDGIITRLEEQLKSSPDSKRLHETLLDYYQSAGRTKEAEETLKKMRADLPDDPAILRTEARKLYSARDYKGACDLYLKMVSLNPELIGEEYYNIRRAFDQAKRHDELVDMFLKLDLSKVQNHYSRVSEMVNHIAQIDNGKRIDDAIKIFQRAWNAFPQYRESLLGSLYTPKLWETDEIFDHSLKVLIPGEQATLSDPWSGVNGGSHSLSSDGTLTGIVSRAFAGISQNEKRTQQFSAEVAAAQKHHPKWLAGTVYLALFDAQAGKTEQAHESMTKLFDDKSNHPPNPQVSWMIASDLSRIAGMEHTALHVLNSIDLDAAASQYQSSSMGYDPRRLMVTLYQKTGDRRTSRDLLFELLNNRDYSQYNSSNPGYGEYQKLRDVSTAGKLLIELKYPLDAIRLMEGTLSDDALFVTAARWGGSNMKQQLQSGLKQARKALTPEILSRSLTDWLPDPDTETYPGIDLMLSVEPSTIESAAIKCLFEESVLSLYSNELPTISARVPVQPLEKSGPTPASARNEPSNRGEPAKPAEAVATLRSQLDRLQSRWPEVVTFPAIEALLLLPNENLKTEQAEAISRLMASVEKHGAEILARETATEQLLAVWLVAREALRSPEYHASGEKLASFVVDSRAGIKDPLWVAAILRERGQISLEAGDRKTAEKYWSLLLAHILEHETHLGKKTTSTGLPASRLRSSFAAPAISSP